MTTPDIEIARKTPLKPIAAIAQKLAIPEGALHAFGPHKAKIMLGWIEKQPPKPDSKLVLVTAISPTPAGEGKTTTTIGLADGLSRIGVKAAVAIREPSLGPCFGMKGGATGGGYAQVAPMEDINLHFNGDFHAITAAHNLLSALIDNHMYWGNALGLDPRKISWRRAMDMNDRALRNLVTGLEGNGVTREESFDITVASEVMAAFCLAENMDDLVKRLSRMVIARDTRKQAVKAEALKGIGSMAALLKDALHPNLVQTLEGTPAFIHGGPFANIAHGCNSVIATKAAMKLADIVVTEAGFGADLGAEKFLNIKCRQAGLKPDAVVLVATLRALKMHGGVLKSDLAREDVDAVRRGLPNLQRHIENMKKFGLRPVVAVNHFVSDTESEFLVVQEACKAMQVEAYSCKHWADGGKGTEGLAKAVQKLVQAPNTFHTLYPDAMPLAEKIRTVASQIYGAGVVEFSAAAEKKLAGFEAEGFGNLPVCMAKTQYSFSSDPALLGAPKDFTLPVRDVRLSAGAGFVVVLCGDIMTMPGLPKIPAAERIGVDEKGDIFGLF